MMFFFYFILKGSSFCLQAAFDSFFWKCSNSLGSRSQQTGSGDEMKEICCLQLNVISWKWPSEQNRINISRFHGINNKTVERSAI